MAGLPCAIHTLADLADRVRSGTAPAAELVLRNLRHFLPAWTIVVVHGNSLEHVSDSYKRYLEGRLREHFKLVGTPVRIEQTVHHEYTSVAATITRLPHFNPSRKTA